MIHQIDPYLQGPEVNLLIVDRHGDGKDDLMLHLALVIIDYEVDIIMRTEQQIDRNNLMTYLAFNART